MYVHLPLFCQGRVVRSSLDGAQGKLSAAARLLLREGVLAVSAGVPPGAEHSVLNSLRLAVSSADLKASLVLQSCFSPAG